MTSRRTLGVVALGLGLGLVAGGACGGTAATAPPPGDARPPALPDPAARIAFADLQQGPDGGERTLDARAILEAGGALERVDGYDPYYQREKRFWAVPLAPVLARGLPGVDLTTAELVLRASDGYAVPIEAARLLDGTAYLAVADVDRLAQAGVPWEPIGPRRADPAPFYVVWKGPDRVDLERFPRPWALARVEHARFEAVFPHTVPGSDAGDEARAGFALFRRDCIRCHAMNREGGRIGPDLNVPRSIVEYRPAEQIRAYIRDPMLFRYGAMPAHPHLRDRDLDALVAYFRDLAHRKFDPERAKAGAP